MKRLTALLMACSMLLALTSCSDKSSSKDEEVTTTAATTTAATTETTTEVTLPPPEIPAPVVDANAITFENGADLFTAQCMKASEFTDDEANCNLSVAEYNGTKQLKVEVIDKNDAGEYKVPKIVFDVDRLVGTENVSRIAKCSLDVTQVAVGMFTGEDGTEMLVPGNLAGKLGSNVGKDCASWLEPSGGEYAVDEWDYEFVYKHIEAEWILETKRYVNGQEGCTLVFMRWAIPNQADVYIDNLTFYDDEGNSIPIVYTPEG